MRRPFYLIALLFWIYSCGPDLEKYPSYELLSAKLAAGKIMRIDSFPSQYIQPRPVDVWLPNHYSTDQKFAVLYMHDGQMLFDATQTWNKQEWKIDEVATQLMEEKSTTDFIVVAIHNIPEIRWLDLFPQKAMDYMDKNRKEELLRLAQENEQDINFNGDNYLKFLIEELKPYIDDAYAVCSDKQHTFVAGSSMGGLMSMYAISQYPDVFEGAACISTHWPGAMVMDNNPYPSAIFKYLSDNVPDSKNHRLYFDYGDQTLDRHYPQYASLVDDIFYKNGYTIDNYRNLFFPGENHSENSWQKRMNIPLNFLLKK